MQILETFSVLTQQCLNALFFGFTLITIVLICSALNQYIFYQYQASKEVICKILILLRQGVHISDHSDLKENACLEKARESTQREEILGNVRESIERVHLLGRGQGINLESTHVRKKVGGLVMEYTCQEGVIQSIMGVHGVNMIEEVWD